MKQFVLSSKKFRVIILRSPFRFSTVMIFNRDDFQPVFPTGILTPEKERQFDEMSRKVGENRIKLGNLSTINCNFPLNLTEKEIILEVEMKLKSDELLPFLENRTYNFRKIQFCFENASVVITPWDCQSNFDTIFKLKTIFPEMEFSLQR